MHLMDLCQCLLLDLSEHHRTVNTLHINSTQSKLCISLHLRLWRAYLMWLHFQSVCVICCTKSICCYYLKGNKSNSENIKRFVPLLSAFILCIWSHGLARGILINDKVLWPSAHLVTHKTITKLKQQ